MRALLTLVVFLAGCGDGLYPAGHPCQSSTECANGLLCDYGVTPHACAGTSSAGTDLAVGNTDAGMMMNADQSVGDLPPPPPDMTTPPDLMPTDL